MEQELASLRRQYEQLRDQKVRAEQDMANLTSQLEQLKGQAKAEYGTDDPDELQALLQQKREENERVVTEYRKHIQQIRDDLAQVEQGAGGANR